MDIEQSDLRADCANCFGLCCVALPFSRSEAFAIDKDAGEPCRNLLVDSTCGIHERLRSSGFSGCTVFDCFGAGQQVSQVTYGGLSWRADPGRAGEMYAVFGVMRALHEMMVLLGQARELAPFVAIDHLATRVKALTALEPVELLDLDVDRLRASVGDLLREVSAAVRDNRGESLAGADLLGADLRDRDLRYADLRGALLVAADLRDVNLSRADLLGADLRDANLTGADVSSALFVTQPQLNAARGNAETELPPGLERPSHW